MPSEIGQLWFCWSRLLGDCMKQVHRKALKAKGLRSDEEAVPWLVAASGWVHQERLAPGRHGRQCVSSARRGPVHALAAVHRDGARHSLDRERDDLLLAGGEGHEPWALLDAGGRLQRCP